MSDEVDLSDFISVNVVSAEPHALTQHGFIESWLRIGYGSRHDDERSAFRWLGGLGFSARRRARRLRLWRIAEEIAERVGHGDEPEPMVPRPDFVVVPISCAAEARRVFGGGE